MNKQRETEEKKLIARRDSAREKAILSLLERRSLTVQDLVFLSDVLGTSEEEAQETVKRLLDKKYIDQTSEAELGVLLGSLSNSIMGLVRWIRGGSESVPDENSDVVSDSTALKVTTKGYFYLHPPISS